MKKEKLIIYGTGGTAKFYAENDMDQDKFELLAFADGNEEKWGESFLGFPIVSPAEIGKMEYDAIIIGSVFFDEIKERLVSDNHVAADKIHSIYYREVEEIRKRYENYYNSHNLRKKESACTEMENVGRCVIYTAIAGDYDQLREPVYVDPNCDYVCFTDNPKLTSNVWEIRALPDWKKDANRSAKQIKVLPHRFLPEYDCSIWVDGAFEITGNLRELMQIYMRNSNILCFMHYRRAHVYEEAEVVGQAGFDMADKISEQMELYRKEGFMDDNELIAGGVLFRKHHQPEVIRLMESWWKEIINHSRRDQLSFNYCAWKEKVIFDMVDENIYENLYLKAYPHNKKKQIVKQ